MAVFSYIRTILSLERKKKFRRNWIIERAIQRIRSGSKRAGYDSHSAESAAINGILSVALTRSILCLLHSQGKIKILASP